MFLDDDIYELVNTHVDALAADLSDHSMSVLIPRRYPDNPLYSSRRGWVTVMRIPLMVVYG